MASLPSVSPTTTARVLGCFACRTLTWANSADLEQDGLNTHISTCTTLRLLRTTTHPHPGHCQPWTPWILDTRSRRCSYRGSFVPARHPTVFLRVCDFRLCRVGDLTVGTTGSLAARYRHEFWPTFSPRLGFAWIRLGTPRPAIAPGGILLRAIPQQ